MILTSAVNLLLGKIRNSFYKSKIEFVGEGTIFGGFHIEIVGGKKRFGKGISIGNHCTIYNNCQIVTDDIDEQCGIVIGNNCHFNYGCYLSGTGGLTIGNDCLFGPGVKLITGGHKFDDTSISIIAQGLTRGSLIIGDNIWVGAGAIILPNVKIQNGAVIAAGSVVNKNVDENAIMAGVPCKVIGYRGDKQNKRC